ncbi:MAG: sterol desaturase family protein [Marinosulfonomonas sp.]|nr:sterol desaturase family protein [Marinosulfonomonas sp.]
MDAFDAFLRVQIDPITYVVFFGLLLFFGLMETWAERSPEPARRAGRWPANVGLTILNIVILGALPVSGVVFADGVREAGMGLFNWVQANPVAALIGGFLVRSFTSWATHLAMHKIPFLWRFHRVHHSDTFLDISTTVRFHPIEFLINLPITLATIAIFGISPVTLMLYELFDAGMNVFTHANIRMPAWLDRTLRTMIVTPDMHRVHHSSYHPETDSNYGATLSIWDHVFRTHTFKEADDLEEMEIGLRELQDKRANSLIWLLALPFRPIRIKRWILGNTIESETAQKDAA